ncbi:grasp-with-spasm system SPASM domain peptide maturase [Chryseobacterium populi]|uniref:Radical SAM additional 4Fe4S-binding domain containing protein n=1 Tax=Chryseobacterium populi TaxID=1144316 RepID=J2JTR8_9FLAO|nr:grasp-with-spasm system SPASM domain peptide maturase [Chryseobacterium populi]EJL71240.1 radical SAM additional 4Fe4S-binding domain containing protein [Chryseobacterium populi]
MTYFNLFSNILITKGASRILISDLQRNISELYPLELNDLIDELKIKPIEDIIKNYDTDSKEIIKEYIDLLLKEEYGFLSQNKQDKNFPPLSYEYKNYNILSNIFIELNDLSVISKIKDSVENLQIKYIVIYYHNCLSINDFLEIENYFKDSVVESIEIFSQYHLNVDKTFIQTLNENTIRISSIIFFNCKEYLFEVDEEYRFTINFTDENLKISSCGKVDLQYFNTNLPKVLEAINYNSCLHQKISIDKDGNIKNCPAMSQSFGNIKNTTLEKVFLQNDLKKYWNLTKDHIEVCKDCEFRYICTDCRAYTEQIHKNDDGLDVSKPLKCGYNPYTAEWEAWSINPLKQKAIRYYGM